MFVRVEMVLEDVWMVALAPSCFHVFLRKAVLFMILAVSEKADLFEGLNAFAKLWRHGGQSGPTAQILPRLSSRRTASTSSTKISRL
jgi:hypothetical protein